MWILAALLSLPMTIYGQLAPTPPMGWNSWDSYGLTINESEFRQNVNWFNTHLKAYGWQYVVIDADWYLAHPENTDTKEADQGYAMDSNGRFTPAINRFPSASQAAGFKPVADYVHSLGLKFGIHIVHGIPRQAVAKNLSIDGSGFHAAEAADASDTCHWNQDNYGVKNNAAGQAYYASLVKLYASWGVDLVKVDCISHPYHESEIHLISAAFKKAERPIVLSLSSGPIPPEETDDVAKQAQMWRISNDFWDLWNYQNTTSDGFPHSALRQFALLEKWEPYAGPGHWPDADMLPFGTLGPRPGWLEARKGRLTSDEMRTVFTLWSIARSPLILGGNLAQTDASIEALLTNREVIAVDQHSTGNNAVVHTPQSWVWTAHATSASGEYIALFNVSDGPLNMEYTWDKLGLGAGKHTVHDLWLHKRVGSLSGVKVTLAAHACAIYRVE